MGRIVHRAQPCLSERCGSSDARQIYEDGTSFCFSCRSWFPKDDTEVTPRKTSPMNTSIKLKEIEQCVSRGFRERNITRVVAEHYKVKVGYDPDGEISEHYYPYESGSAYKVRKLPKSFSWVGNSTELFGKELFNGGGKRVIIAEGEIDTLSLAQATYTRYQKFYPIVGLSSATIAEKSLLANRDWLRSFQEIILCFDQDSAGEEAVKVAIRILGIDKVKVAKLPYKDAGETFLKSGAQKLLSCIFEATPFIPSGIITKEALWEAVVDYNNTPSVPYPSFLEGLNFKTKGMRFGEISLFISGTSCGKSTLMREIKLHLKNVTDARIGVVSLEESPAETARKLSAMELRRNPAEHEIPIEQLEIGFNQVFGDDRFVVLDHQGSMEDETILDKIEYMALLGCKYIFIDHITILVSEGANGLTGNEAIDKVMSDLLKFVKRHNVWVGLVSHLRKTPVGGKAFEQGAMPNLDDIKGSGSVKQISFDIVAFARNLTADDDIEKNTIEMSLLKCRYTGLTGPVGSAYYNFDTGRFEPPRLVQKVIVDDDFTSL